MKNLASSLNAMVSMRGKLFYVPAPYAIRG